MDTVVLAGRLLLGAVFATAGLAKLRDPAGTRATMVAFGLRDALAGPAARALPPAELAVAAALLFAPTASWGALAALALLVAFIGGITTAIRHHRTPDCGCFGKASAKTVSRRTVARNAALAAVALVVLIGGPGPALDDWLADRSGVELALLAAVALALLIAAFALLRRRAAEAAATRTELTRPTDGLEVGSAAPEFDLPGACEGARSTASLFARGLPVVLVFTSGGCLGCGALYAHLGRWQRALADRLVIAVITTAQTPESRALCEEHGIAEVLRDDARPSLWSEYRMPRTPSAVVLAPEGTIASRPAAGHDAIEELVRLTLRRQPQDQTRSEAGSA